MKLGSPTKWDLGPFRSTRCPWSATTHSYLLQQIKQLCCKVLLLEQIKSWSFLINSFNSFIQAICTAPLQSTTTQRRSPHSTDTASEFHDKAPQAFPSEVLAQGSYVVAWARFKPTNLRTNLPMNHHAPQSTNEPPCPTIYLWATTPHMNVRPSSKWPPLPPIQDQRKREREEITFVSLLNLSAGFSDLSGAVRNSSGTAQCFRHWSRTSDCRRSRNSVFCANVLILRSETICCCPSTSFELRIYRKKLSSSRIMSSGTTSVMSTFEDEMPGDMWHMRRFRLNKYCWIDTESGLLPWQTMYLKQLVKLSDFAPYNNNNSNYNNNYSNNSNNNNGSYSQCSL